MVSEGRIFSNRSDAGIELGKLLSDRYKNKNALILGIPRGGVAIAYEIARMLNCELSVLVAKKIPHPENEEFAIGAIAEDGSFFLAPEASAIDKTTIAGIMRHQQQEVRSRIQRFRNADGLPDMDARVVIIADDGIATGATIFPAIDVCRNRGAAKIIVAAPVAGEQAFEELSDRVDELVIAEHLERFYAVGQVYDDFHTMSDEEVITLLTSARNRN